MSEPKADGGQAFPCINPHFDGNWDKRGVIYGMSLRDYLAGQALMGMLAADENPTYEIHGTLAGKRAESAYKHADEMIKARDK